MIVPGKVSSERQTSAGGPAGLRRAPSPSVLRSPVWGLFHAVLLALLAAGSVLAQEEPEAPDPELVISRAVVPAIGQIVGAAGVLWRSDVALVNDSAQPATIVISPLPMPESFQMRTLEPGESLLFTNVGADSFGVANAVVPLLVQTLARRSVTVFATAYGLSEGRLTPTIILPILYGELPPSVQHLRGLSMTDHVRTNVGIMNFDAAPATVLFALQRLEGRPIAVQTVVVPPEGSFHVPLNALFPLVEDADDFTLVVDSAAPRTFSYAVVLSNDTHAGTFVLPLAFPR